MFGTARIASILLLVALLTGGIAYAQRPPEDTAGASAADGHHSRTHAQPQFVPHQLLVRYAPSAPAARTLDARAAVGAETLRHLPVPRLELVELPAGTPVRAAARELERDPSVLYAEPNGLDRITAIPDDPRFGEQWSLHNVAQKVDGRTGLADADIDAPEAWEVTTGSRKVTVAVIDTGIARRHPDLAGNIWVNRGESGPGERNNGVDDDRNGFVDDVNGWNFAGGTPKHPRPNNRPDDDFGHGSHIAGIIGAEGDNGVGIAGINWDVSLMPLKVNYGPLVPRSLSIRAIAYADKMGADVVNLSIGGPSRSQAFADAIASARDVFFVTPAGNTGRSVDSKPFYPCAYRGSNNNICVAATNNRDNLASFSSYGSKQVDLAAPGEATFSVHARTGPSGGVVFSEQVINHGFTRPDPLDGDTGGDWETGGFPNTWELQLGFNELGDRLVDSKDAPYPNNANTWVSTGPLNLRHYANCELNPVARLDTQPEHDFLRIEAASEGGPWTTLAKFSGRRGTRNVRLRNLKPVEGKPAVRIRLRLTSDGQQVAQGVAIDHVYMSCVSTARYQHESGTSFSVPHVAGTAALMLSKHPRLHPRAVRRRILRSVDRVPGLAGKVRTGGRLNAAAALGR